MSDAQASFGFESVIEHSRNIQMFLLCWRFCYRNIRTFNTSISIDSIFKDSCMKLYRDNNCFNYYNNCHVWPTSLHAERVLFSRVHRQPVQLVLAYCNPVHACMYVDSEPIIYFLSTTFGAYHSDHWIQSEALLAFSPSHAEWSIATII